MALAARLAAGVWCVCAGLSVAEASPQNSILASLMAPPALNPLPYGFASFDERLPSLGLGSVFQSPVSRVPTSDPQPTRQGIRWGRAVTWGASNAVAMVMAYRQSQAVWGESRGKFHFKNDLRGDGMALNDEVSHLFVSHRLTRALNTGYRWVGMKEGPARRAAAYEAWLWTLAVEFPIDAFNPDQGFGVSDLVANTLGVLSAHRHSGEDDPRWDIQVSVKPSFFNGRSRVIAHTNQQYDDYIYWVTARPIRSRWIPLSVGLGYSTTHGVYPGLSKEIHLGVGLSVDRLGGAISPSLGRFLRPLNFYFLNIGGKIVWR